MDRLGALLFALVLGVFFVQDATAQLGGGFPGGGGMRGGMRGGGSRERNPTREGERPIQPNTVDDIEDRLGLLEDDLQLTAAQQTAWQRYADRVKALASDIARERGRSELAEKQTVVQQIDHAVDIARNRLTALEDIAAAAKSLYGTLAPEQQTRADPRLANIVMSLAGSQQWGQPPGMSSSRRPVTR
jgi:periplasmic protein CpxP/Spy